MLTLFTTPKPFLGHIDVIQRNALKSWKLLHPEVEVILFGDDEGAADVAREFGIRHEPHVDRNGGGMKRIDYMFLRAQAIAGYDLLCYVNCDIILTSDFPLALDRVRAKYRRFLMVGRRWDTPIERPIAFSDGWDIKIRNLAVSTNDRRNHWFIDYFVFPRGSYGDDFPQFVIGTVRWDNWLIWKALQAKFQVVDASPVVVAVHQNHDYSYHPQGKQGVWEGEEAKRNHELAGGWAHLRTISDATIVLRARGFTINPKHYFRALHRNTMSTLRPLYYNLWRPVWFVVLDITRPLRNILGLRSRAARQKA
jgi:hypothetical protein